MSLDDRLEAAGRRIAEADVPVPPLDRVRKRRRTAVTATVGAITAGLIAVVGVMTLLRQSSSEESVVATEGTTKAVPETVAFETYRYTLSFLPEHFRVASSVIDSAGRVDMFERPPGPDTLPRLERAQLVITVGFGPWPDEELKRTVEGGHGEAIEVNGRPGVLLDGGRAIQWQYSEEVSVFMSGGVSTDVLMQIAEGLRLRDGPVGQPKACSAAWMDTKLLSWRASVEMARQGELGWQDHAKAVTASVDAVENECAGRFEAAVATALHPEALQKIGERSLAATYPEGPNYVGDPKLLDDVLAEIDRVLSRLYANAPDASTDGSEVDNGPGASSSGAPYSEPGQPGDFVAPPRPGYRLANAVPGTMEADDGSSYRYVQRIYSSTTGSDGYSVTVANFPDDEEFGVDALFERYGGQRRQIRGGRSAVFFRVEGTNVNTFKWSERPGVMIEINGDVSLEGMVTIAEAMVEQ